MCLSHASYQFKGWLRRCVTQVRLALHLHRSYTLCTYTGCPSPGATIRANASLEPLQAAVPSSKRHRSSSHLPEYPTSLATTRFAFCWCLPSVFWWLTHWHFGNMPLFALGMCISSCFSHRLEQHRKQRELQTPSVLEKTTEPWKKQVQTPELKYTKMAFSCMRTRFYYFLPAYQYYLHPESGMPCDLAAFH